MRTHDRVVLVLFTVSGASGLIYQVVWVREFGNVFGNSVHSAAVVTAVFMLGLGLGSLVAGSWADRRTDRAAPLRAYGIVEAAIALWGLALAALLPTLAALGGGVSSYVTDAAGFHVLSAGTVALRGAAAFVLLFPATFAMGATLTLLVRFVVLGHLAEAGWRIGLLFGLNTVGAAVGAIATDLLFVPNLGLFATQSVAAMLNLVAAVGALRLAGDVTDAPVEARPPDPDVNARASLVGATAGLALAGFAGMGFEILWFRLASSVLGERRVVFSMMLAVILIGIAIGSLVGGWLERRFGRPVAFYVAGQAAFAIAAVVGLLAVDKHAIISGFYDVRDVRLDTFGGLWRGSWWPTLRPILGLCLPPALAMGVAFPLANAAVQRVAGRVGFRAGLLYLANTIGAVLGSLLVGLVALPALGIHGTASLLLAVIAATALVFSAAFWRGVPQRRRIALVTGVAAAVAAAGGWGAQPEDDLWRQQFLQLRDASLKVVDRADGTYQSILVIESPDGSRVLVTNGYSMSATNPVARRYMRAFAHVPLLQVESPKDALVICFGVGNTAHAAGLHPVDLDIVDLSRTVLELGDRFAATNGGVLERDNVEVFVNDGRNHLAAAEEESYDLVTMEPPPIAHAGIASLYSEDFYALAKSRLRPGGFVTQWLPAYQVPPALQRAVIAAFVAVFEDAVLLVGASEELILVGRKGVPNRLDPDVVERSLAARPAVREDLARIGIGSVADLVAMFASHGERLAALTRNDPPVTDDFPVLEYTPPWFDRCPLETGMFDPASYAEWCPKCAGRDDFGAAFETRMLRLGAYYHSPEFLGQRLPCD